MSARDEALHILLMNSAVIGSVHGPELQEFELAAVLANPILTEKNGASGSQLDGDGNCNQDWQKDNQGEEAAYNVHGPFHQQSRRVTAVPHQARMKFQNVGTAAALLVPIFRKDMNGDSDPSFACSIL